MTWYEPGFYTVSLGDWEMRHQIPPIRTLVMYYIAGILPATNRFFLVVHTFITTLREGRTKAISDTCPRGNDDVLLSMKGARVCTKCARIYRQYGCNEEALAAVRKILNYVREETARYDKGIPYEVFISYSHQDRLFVDRLVRDLEDRRLKVWRDGFMLLPGQGIIEKVINGIATSRFLLCVLSRKSVRSKWVKKELEVAVTRSLEHGTDKIAVLPTLIEDCKIPQVLYGLYYVSFHDNYDLALNKVVAAVQVQRRQRTRTTKSAKQSRS